MTISRLTGLFALMAFLAGCGSNEPKEVVCENDLKYQNRVEGKRVVAPEGLNDLEPLAEMPTPKADPNAPRFAEGTCNDSPPMIQVGDS